MVIFCQNSLYSILSLVFTIVGSCYILFSLQVEFLTFLLLLIYIGAITVLFLFVVMMLQLHQDSHKPSSFFMFTQNFIIYFLLFVKLLAFVYFFTEIFCSSLSLFSFDYFRDIEILASTVRSTESDTIYFISLFSSKALLFIIIGLSLLFSMTGSIAVCLSNSKDINNK